MLPFVLIRLPYFLYHRLPIPFPDTATYLWPVQAIESGRLPVFDLRTPGYSLFWWACRLLSHDIGTVVVAQNVLTALVAAVSLVLLWRHAPRVVSPASLACAVFLSSNAHLTADLTLLSESLFTSTMMAWALLIFLTLETRRPGFALLASLAAAAAIYVRPSSLAVLVINVAVAAYMKVWRRGYRTPILLVAPACVALGLLVVYNAATIDVVGLSGGGTWARLWSTTVYLDPDPSLPPAINEGMAAKNAALSPQDRAVIYGSGDLAVFRSVLERNIGVGIGQIADRLTGWPTPTGWRYMEHRAVLNGVANTAIRQHPQIYFRNAIGTLIDYFSTIGEHQFNPYATYPATTLYDLAFVNRPFYVINLDGYYNPPPPRGFRRRIGEGGTILVTAPEHRLEAWYARVSRLRSLVFEHTLWIWVLPIGTLTCLLRVWMRKGDAVGAVALLAMIAAVAGNAAASAFIGHTEPRYAQPLYFVDYLLAALAVSPLMLATKGLLRRVAGARLDGWRPRTL